MKGSILLAAWSSACPALAQNDEWTTFLRTAAAGRDATGEEGRDGEKKDEPKKEEPKKRDLLLPTRSETPRAGSRSASRPAEQGKPIPKELAHRGQPADPAAACRWSPAKRASSLHEPHSRSTWGHAFVDDNSRVTVGSAGIGIGDLQAARLGPKGVLRFSLLGEYTTLNDFPVRPRRTFARRARSRSRSCRSAPRGVPGHSATANTNSRTSPNLDQALGDSDLA